MTKKEPNLYEGMYIISAQLSEEARKKALDRIKKEIESEGGEIAIIHDMGRKKLAYEIHKHREGYYFLIFFRSVSQAVDRLIAEYHLNEDLVRFMILRAEKVQENLEFKQLAKVQ